MNKLATALLILAIATVLIGCSSGSSSSPEPTNISGRFEGTFRNNDGTQTGTAVFDLNQPANSLTVTGNALFDRAGGNTCLLSGPVTGTVSGFRASLAVGEVNFELNTNEGGTSLQGTYVRTAAIDMVCGLPTGSGEITLNRT